MGIGSTSGTLVPLVPVKWYHWYQWSRGLTDPLVYTSFWVLLVLPPLYQVVADLVPSEYLAAFVLLISELALWFHELSLSDWFSNMWLYIVAPFVLCNRTCSSTYFMSSLLVVWCLVCLCLLSTMYALIFLPCSLFVCWPCVLFARFIVVC
jgi:hypothetical protein